MGKAGAGLPSRVTREMVPGEDAQILPSLEGFAEWVHRAISGPWASPWGQCSCTVAMWQGGEDAHVPAVGPGIGPCAALGADP
jgi:hypothetical protein